MSWNHIPPALREFWPEEPTPLAAQWRDLLAGKRTEIAGRDLVHARNSVLNAAASLDA